MILFYQSEITGPYHTLDKEESRHCIQVLRMKTGDTVHLTDGKGKLCATRIMEEDPKRCVLKIIESTQNKFRSSSHVHLAVAPTKNISRYEWFLEKATEIGVDEITPVLCDNSERKIVKTDRLNKILIAGMKQSLTSFLPRLNEPMPFDQFVSAFHDSQKFIAYCSDEFRDLLKTKYQKGMDCIILIGPEGDFSKKEVDLALKHNFHPVSLGNSRLRTETAGIVSCHTIQLVNQ